MLNPKQLIRIGILLLALASFSHLVEHWESSVLQKCISTCEHSHASSDDGNTSQTSHHHGCSAHEHSPAILQANQPFLPQPIVLSSTEIRVTPPPAIPAKIDHPPRIS